LRVAQVWDSSDAIPGGRHQHQRSGVTHSRALRFEPVSPDPGGDPQGLSAEPRRFPVIMVITGAASSRR
jgi:hypothetical protein